MTFAKRILVPVDPSDPAPEALRLARDMAQAFGAELKALAVLPFAGEPEWSEGEMDGGEKMRADLWDRYAAFLSPGPGPVGPLSAVEVRRGEPWREIVFMAGEMNADLIVMGTHGRKGWTRSTVGSVTESVIRNAPCPVVALRIAGPAPAAWSGPEAVAAGLDVSRVEKVFLKGTQARGDSYSGFYDHERTAPTGLDAWLAA